MPNLILGTEEPELYQHPSRQRHLASILWQLPNGQIPGVAGALLTASMYIGSWKKRNL